MKREEAIKTLNELWRETNDPWYEEVYNMAIEALKDRLQGEWIAEEEDGDLWVCDQCGCVSGSKDNFCHNCGADMRGEE